jgi:hypothetical protein
MKQGGAGTFDKKTAVVAMTLDKSLKSASIFSCSFGCERDIPSALVKDLLQILCLKSFNGLLLGLPKR